MELKMPGTDLHAELLKTKRKSKAKPNIDIKLSLDFKLDKIASITVITNNAKPKT